MEQIYSHKRYLFRKPRPKPGGGGGGGVLKIHNTLTNYIILESKYFLYRCKLNKTPLSILHLTEKN